MNKKEFLKTIEEHVGTKVQFVEKDTKFKFVCDGCRDGSSRCCCNRGDERIIINPYDIYKLQKGLKMEAPEIIKKYMEIISGGQSGYPLMLLGTKVLMTGEEICPFIKKRKDELGRYRRYCSVHDFKPGVCRIFPLGRVQSPGEDIIYILQEVNCGLKPKETDPAITIKDMVPDLENEDRAFMEYHKFLAELSKIMDFSKFDKSKKISGETKFMFNAAFTFILCDFNGESDKDYFEQFKENTEKVIELVEVAVASLGEIDKDIIAKPKNK